MVWAYDISKYEKFSWQSALFGLLFMLGILATVRGFATRNHLLTDGARLQRWRTKNSVRVAVVEVRENRTPRVIRIAEMIVGWFSDGETLIEPGMTFEVFGRLKHRGWIVALTEPPLYPAGRLD